MSKSLVRLQGRDLISIGDLDAPELQAVLDLAADIKAGRYREQPLAGRAVAMLFQKPSMRTRVSFEVGVRRLGGAPVALGEQDVQIGVRETVGDAAHVLSRYVDLIVARLRRHQDLLALAAAASVPVVNALTEVEHPCQVLADLLTIEEKLAGLAGKRVVFVGDGNNIARSLWLASQRLGFQLTVVGPAAYALAEAPEICTPDLAAVEGADAVYTDVWTSMGFEAERERRLADFRAYQVDAALLARAPEAVFMHCLPAHRGEEVTDEVIDGPRSVVLDQAENRLHAQMALLALIA